MSHPARRQFIEDSMLAAAAGAAANDAVGKGIATVPVAALGAPPMAPARADGQPLGALSGASIWLAGRPRSPSSIALFRLKQADIPLQDLRDNRWRVADTR